MTLISYLSLQSICSKRKKNFTDVYIQTIYMYSVVGLHKLYLYVSLSFLCARQICCFVIRKKDTQKKTKVLIHNLQLHSATRQPICPCFSYILMSNVQQMAQQHTTQPPDLSSYSASAYPLL